MTKYLILIAILVLIYLYWKHQQKTIPHQPDDIIERKGKNKQTVWEAKDWELNSDNEDDSYYD